MQLCDFGAVPSQVDQNEVWRPQLHSGIGQCKCGSMNMPLSAILQRDAFICLF